MLYSGFPAAITAVRNVRIRLPGIQMAAFRLIRKQRRNCLRNWAKSYVSGITLSGGDPLHPANRLDIRALVHEIREKFPTKTIWLYTGYLWEQISHFEVMQYVDVCVDGEYEKDKRNVQLHWKGSSNQRVIDVPKSLETGKVCLYCE